MISPDKQPGGITLIDMNHVMDLVYGHVDKVALNNLLGQLRALDNDLDKKMEDIRVAQQSITVADRINIFTNTDTELHLKEENRIYKAIRDEHGQVVVQIKELIRSAIYKDFSVVMKIQAGEIMKAISALRVEHRWGFGGKAYEYQIQGVGALRERVGHLGDMINTQYGFPQQPLDTEELLNLVYDDILRKEGFVE